MGRDDIVDLPDLFVGDTIDTALAPERTVRLRCLRLQRGHLILNWIGRGALERAPTVLGPWNSIIPVPTPPYADPIASGDGRFYRLRKP